MIDNIPLLIDSIAHWERMIAWAEQRQPKDSYSNREMYQSLGEQPDSTCCALCEAYNLECAKCPLGDWKQPCAEDDSVYSKAALSTTWGNFVINAKEMKKLLEDLLEEFQTERRKK